jgi:hypothetical protein
MMSPSFIHYIKTIRSNYLQIGCKSIRRGHPHSLSISSRIETSHFADNFSYQFIVNDVKNAFQIHIIDNIDVFSLVDTKIDLPAVFSCIFFTPLNNANPDFNIVENYGQNVLFQQQLYRLSTGENWNFRQKA